MLILSSCMRSYLFQQCVKDCWKLNYFFIHVQQFKTEKIILHISRSHKVHRQFSISYLCHLKRISDRSKLAKKGDTSLFNNQPERNYQKSIIENQNVENKEGLDQTIRYDIPGSDKSVCG